MDYNGNISRVLSVAPPPTKAEFLESLIPEQCPICYTTTLAEPIKTECNHIFCLACLEPWIEKSNTCPSCRKVLYERSENGLDFGDDEEEDEEEDEGNVRQQKFFETCAANFVVESGWIFVRGLVRKVNEALGWAHVPFDEDEACDLFEQMEFDDRKIRLCWVKVDSGRQGEDMEAIMVKMVLRDVGWVRSEGGEWVRPVLRRPWGVAQ